MCRPLPYGALCWLFLIWGWASPGVVSAQVAIVAHQGVPVDSLDRNTLLRLYSGEIEYWSNGERVVIVDLNEKGEIRDAFYAYLGKNSSRMRSIWLKRKLTGEGELPLSAGAEPALLQAVASTPGAIGFARLDLARLQSGIKVLDVLHDERSAGAPGG